jgi:hypothetical protein
MSRSGPPRTGVENEVGIGRYIGGGKGGKKERERKRRKIP